MRGSDCSFVFYQSDGSQIEDAFVFGERNSGTNYLSELLKRNFVQLSDIAGDRIDRFGFRYGWKHGFATMVAAPHTTLCVVVVRHPETWLRSMYKRPWHTLSSIRKKSFSEFIRSEWICSVDERNFGVTTKDSRWLSELQYDRHPLTGERFSSIIELRNVKTSSFLGFRNRFANFALVRLEDVQDNPAKFIRDISAEYKLKANSEFCNVVQRRGKELEGEFSKSSYAGLSENDQKLLWSQLDVAQESKLGYHPRRDEDFMAHSSVGYSSNANFADSFPNVAVYFHPEGYTTSGPKLMGRNAAGESFLRGFLKHSRAKQFAVQVTDRAHAQSFLAVSRSFDRTEPVVVVDKSNLGRLRAHGVVYHPGEKRAKVGDALRGGISWRCSVAVNSLPRKGYATCQRLPSPNFPIHLDLAPTR